MEDTVADINEEQKFKSDLRYIENEIITKQKDGKYCKYSIPLRAISTVNMTEDQLLGYWLKMYKHSKYLDQIQKAYEQKLKTGLTSRKEMIRLIENSKDREVEKQKVLELLGVKKK